ncbi:hypothetical protein AAFC00_003613 [Neodothiora populina]|uniref:Ribosome biogenesis regulatory protein n=1 Tax=Neodothiora populina TaxID=2781224 RepID=A0ABR3PER8_9PEZI
MSAPEAMALDSADTTTKQQQRLPITVAKPIPYTFDLGHLVCNDSNPLPPTTSLTEADMTACARDCAQALLNQLLSTCPVTRAEDSVTLTLPQPLTLLPREKPIPAEKPLTKWQEFAKKKGIRAKTRDSNLVYDEDKGEWVPKWGYKGKNKEAEKEWLVEVDEKKEKASGEPGDARKEKRNERVERMRRQERRERANEKRGTASGGVGKKRLAKK